MLNEEKVILMTRMASYEEKEGAKCRKIADYFRGDYVAIQILKTILYATIAFGILFGLYVFYDFEEFMQNIYKMDLISFIRNVLTYYAITVASYVVITYLHATWRYYKARKSLKQYYQNLKKLNAFYREHNN